VKTSPKFFLALLLAAFAVSDARAMRWYSPSTGRWFSRDPIEERGGLNLYCILANNAVSGIDALGLEEAIPRSKPYNISVKKCQIYVAYGHNWVGRDDLDGLNLITNISGTSCSYATAVGCYSSSVPNSIPLPGYHPPSYSLKVSDRDPDDAVSLSTEFGLVANAVLAVAPKMCNSCCTKIEVISKSYGISKATALAWPTFYMKKQPGVNEHIFAVGNYTIDCKTLSMNQSSSSPPGNPK
jgi:hypothetical protein